MPPWAVFAPRMTTLLKGKAIDRLATTLRCRKITLAPSLAIRNRSASTYVSPTTINVRPNIPPKNLELYDALSELSGSAEAYVNLSRLQLALRGVAAQDVVTRVAVLGLKSQISAQRLVRLLLADPLGAEEGWEKELDERDNGAVLLRYGDELDAPPPTSQYRILSVPSRVLQTHNLEILVSTLNLSMANAVNSPPTESSVDTLLVPKLQAATASGLPVPFPVHKTLILGENLDSAFALGRFASDAIEDAGDAVKVAISLPPPLEEVGTEVDGTSTPVNVDIGKKALATFRESIANSQKYERGWFRSGMPGLSKWLGLGLQPVEPIKPMVKTLITSVIDEVETNVTKEDVARLQELAVTAQQTAKEPIIGHLEDWAEKSHTELRDELDEAFSARNWHKLAWWKLFWRVDDVTMIASEIIERRWLVSAEKNSIYLAGRMNQAGFPEQIQSLPIIAPTEQLSSSAKDDASQEQASVIPDQKASTDVSTDLRPPQPWPSQISLARTDLLSTTIPPLQALAQRLVLSTLSTTSVSSALSALLYVSVSTVSVFEASAIAALGLMFSLRRMQKLWEGAREQWQIGVREEGRTTLKRTEELVRMIIGGFERPAVVDPKVKDRKAAREAVDRVRRALEKL